MPVLFKRHLRLKDHYPCMSLRLGEEVLGSLCDLKGEPSGERQELKCQRLGEAAAEIAGKP